MRERIESYGTRLGAIVDEDVSEPTSSVNACADAIASAYLIDLEVPEGERFCPSEGR